MAFEDGKKLKIFTGNANPALAKEICDYLGLPLGEAFVGRFNNGEVQIMIDESVRGKDVFIIQPTSYPVNDNLMELMVMADALKRASARHITAVVPYYGYARQDRKTRGREPITAKLVANLMQTSGITRLVTIDLHAGQIQGFFDVPVDNIYATPILLRELQSRNYENPVVVSPDVGGVVRARAMAKSLNTDMVIIDKRRPRPNVAEVMNLIGEVAGRTCIITDDIVDTAGTLCNAAKALKERGAIKVCAYITHPVLSGPAIERITNSDLDELVVTDTIPLREDALKCPKITQVSVANIFGETISRIAREDSVSALFENC